MKNGADGSVFLYGPAQGKLGFFRAETKFS
jgi:hypothetical protein